MKSDPELTDEAELNPGIPVHPHDFIGLIKEQSDIEKIFFNPLLAHTDAVVTDNDFAKIGADFKLHGRK